MVEIRGRRSGATTGAPPELASSTGPTLARALLLGGVGGAVLAALVGSVDLVHALRDPQYRALYGLWSEMLIAVPVGALVGLACSLVAAVTYLSVRARTQRPVRFFTSLAAALPLLILGTVGLRPSFFVTFLVAGVAAFGYAFLTFPLIAQARGDRVDTAHGSR